jgi:hypothetical protein
MEKMLSVPAEELRAAQPVGVVRAEG